MILYLIGGLGADERVFQYLDIKYSKKVIKWIEPIKNESIKEYATRLIGQIDTSRKIGLLGVIFGGIIAIELANILKPQITILVSSVEFSNQLPKRYIRIGRTGILNILPDSMIKLPQFVMNYMFGAKNKRLLTEIIKDTKPAFIKWALQKIVSWKNESILPNIVRIHGTRDKLIPLIGKAIEIENGEHFMIVDNAKEISRLITAKMDDAG